MAAQLLIAAFHDSTTLVQALIAMDCYFSNYCASDVMNKRWAEQACSGHKSYHSSKMIYL